MSASVPRRQIKTPQNKSPSNTRPSSAAFHKTQKINDYLPLITDNLPALISYVDKKERYRFVNKTFELWRGVKKEKVLGKKIKDVIRKREYNEIQPYITAVLEGKQVTFEGQLLYKRHGKRHVSATYVPHKVKGDIQGFFALVTDITDRELGSKKDIFMSIASHELKNPISAIKAYTQILEKRLTKIESNQNSYFLTNIRSQTEKITSLISDLLNVGNIERGKLYMNKATFDLDELIKNTVVDFQYINSSHTIHREGKALKQIYADKDRIGQIIINLLSNAIKYSPPESMIIIKTTVTNKTVIVSVKDSGIGIPKDKLTKVFDRFYRIKEINGKEGFSLGL